jgi:predicted transcriptional regulator
LSEDKKGDGLSFSNIINSIKKELKLNNIPENMVKQSLERLQLKDVIYEHKRTKNYVLSDEYIKRMTQYNKEYDAMVSKIHDNLANKLKESISDITENLIKKIIVLFENYLALVFSLMSVARAPHKLISDDGTMILQVV